MIHFKETPYGFEYGDAEVTRIHGDEKRKWVVIEISTSKKTLQVYVTKTGKVRVWDDNMELLSAKK